MGLLDSTSLQGREAGRGKAAYIWIFPDPAKARPTLISVFVPFFFSPS